MNFCLGFAHIVSIWSQFSQSSAGGGGTVDDAEVKVPQLWIQRTALKDFVTSCTFYLVTGGLELAKLPELFQGNKLDKGVWRAGVL